MKTIIVRYGELALKSEWVRGLFERKLIENIRLSLSGLSYKLRRERGRIFIDTNSPCAAVRRLVEVPGIVSVSPSIRVEATIDQISRAAIGVARKILSPGMSFAIRTSRVGEHAFSSKYVNERVGSIILEKIKGVHVDLSNPDEEISIEVRGGSSYVFTETARGVGGLPVGSQGKATMVFSGGLNSMVAAYSMMKRGCLVLPLFFDMRPNFDGQARRLAVGAARRLARFYPKLELLALPSGRVLRVLKKIAPHHAYFIYKRWMLRAAETIAEQVGAAAVVTDEGRDQIAREGLAGLRLIEEACGLPILRPLAGMGGEDVVEMARLVKLFYNFVEFPEPIPPPSDLISVEIDEVREIEGRLKVDALLEAAISKLKVMRVRRSAWT